jgi:hypothetical protein
MDPEVVAQLLTRRSARDDPLTTLTRLAVLAYLNG